MMGHLSPPVHFLPLMALATIIALSLTANASVDESKPDLSMFKLRPVDTKQLARSRLGTPIIDLASGAVHMHESLFVEAPNVKCPAYAHLFKLIKQQRLSPTTEQSLIRQNFVETLAMMITYDRILYHELFLRQANQVSTDHFIEAIKLLEREEDDSELAQLAAGKQQSVWYDLIQCLEHYMAGRLGQPQVDQLLREPGRQKMVANLARFRSIPVVTSIRAPVEGETAPDGLVRNLANKYEAGIMRRRMLSAEGIRKANEQIEALEDATTNELRHQIMEEQEMGVAGDDKLIEADERVEQVSPSPEDEPLVVVVPTEEQLPTSETEVVEVVVPSTERKELEEEVGDSSSSSSDDEPTAGEGPVDETQSAHFREAQLAILKFIKMRLEQGPSERFERAPRLSMQLAFDFSNHWDELTGAAPDTTELGRLASDFLNEPQNVALAKRVRAAIETYVGLTKVLSDLRGHEDQYESMDDLRIPLERLTELLDSMDGSFDVDDLRRLHSIWMAKYTEYNTMDSFINSDSW